MAVTICDGDILFSELMKSASAWDPVIIIPRDMKT